ncbi:hypothetical protein P4V43_09235 [Brevibacillus fortis]|uniref:hypothetical protein n=1 Tax=Brevibacillus fortis TaxID=2126352 RepID=UPI002E1A17F0|nr:hypothetical protein [Brevibacillus fortis]
MREVKDYESDWEEFWKEICINPDGSINLDQIKRELSDYRMVMKTGSEVYCHITGNAISKVNTRVSAIISEADAHYESIHEKAFLENHVSLYRLSEEMFGFEISERSHDLIAETIPYTLIHEGVPLKKISPKTSMTLASGRKMTFLNASLLVFITKG